MGELSGGLIQMTAHMVTRPEAVWMMAAGGTVAGLAALTAIWMAANEKKPLRWALVAAAVAAVGLMVMISGVKKPRVKQLLCCASGPVSLEQIGAVYDIKGVDGKLLTLWER